MSKRCESTRHSKSFYSSTHPTVRLLGILEEKSIQRGIIIFPGNMTPSARKVNSGTLVSGRRMDLTFL